MNLFPKLQAGQILTYRICLSPRKQANTQSSVESGADAGRCRRRSSRACFAWRSLASRHRARAPRSTRARALRFSTRKARLPASLPHKGPQGIAVEFTILPNGRIGEMKNFDALSPDQQQAWQQWASTFAAAAVFPSDGIKVAQKWKSEEVEKSPSPIAGLTWTRESTYLRNEPCRAAQITDPRRRHRFPPGRPKPAPWSRPPPRSNNSLRRKTRLPKTSSSTSCTLRAPPAARNQTLLLHLPSDWSPGPILRSSRSDHGCHHRQSRRLQPRPLQHPR